MRWANADKGRILATPGAAGNCPVCGGQLVAKCGEIISWHWAHKTKDCDYWSEPESEWHRAWKAKFPERWQECTIGCHRADVVSAIGVIEFQNSFLSTQEIKERETFYSNLIWVVNASTWSLKRKKRRPTICIKYNPQGERLFVEWKQDRSADSFEWIRPRKNWATSLRPVYLDIGSGSCHLFLLKKIKTEKRKTIAETQRIRKSDFLRMCHGWPLKGLPLLTDHSSFNYYADAMRRREEVITKTRLKHQLLFMGLPLFAGQLAP